MSQPSLTVMQLPKLRGKWGSCWWAWLWLQLCTYICDMQHLAPQSCCPSPRAGHPAWGLWVDGAGVKSNVSALAAARVWDAIVAPLGLEEPWHQTAPAAGCLGARLPPRKPPPSSGPASPNRAALGQCYLYAFAVSMCLSCWFLLVLVVTVISSPGPAVFHALLQSCSSLPMGLTRFFSVLHCSIFHTLSTAYQDTCPCAKACHWLDRMIE